ncbi:MAG: MarR family winged helix-turn-helix transcriptional regulator [Myxococcota bacterium]
MSVSRAHSLMVLYEADDGIRISDLAGELHIDMSNVSRLCEKLERDDLVERRPCPDDGRAKRLYLTREGRAAAAEVDAASLSKFASILEQMPDRTLGQVLESLSILNRAIEDYEDS